MTGEMGQAERGYSRARTLAATRILIGILTAALISWAVLPWLPGAGPRLALICAAVAGLAGLGQLALADLVPSGELAGSIPQRIGARLIAGIQTTPWAEILTVAVLVLEVWHRARPWHTGVLGVALLGYLLAVHLVETGARPRVLRPQGPLLAAGLGVLALAVGAASGPTMPAGLTSAVVRIVAVAAAVAAGVLVVPVWLRDR